MSEVERRKATLKMVTTCEHAPYGDNQEWSVQDYINSEYGLYCEDELSGEASLCILRQYYEDEYGEESPYYLVDGKLFKMGSEEEVDADYNVSAYWSKTNTIEVDCTWYNGVAGFSEVVSKALKKMED